MAPERQEAFLAYAQKRADRMIGPTPRSIDEVLFWLRSVANGQNNGPWERNFALSILRQAKRPTWNPTPKQERMMRALVDEFLTPAPTLFEEELEG